MHFRNVFFLLAAMPLLAGGEYDSFHAGLRGGIIWSPDQSFGGLGSSSGTISKAAMQFAGSVGFEAMYSVVPGRFGIGLVGDVIRPIHKSEGTPENDGENVNQTIIRGELRFSFASRGNTNEGINFFISPTFNRVFTNHDTLGSLKENQIGVGTGLQGMRFRETVITYWELGAYYLPSLSSGTEAGNLSLELRVGFLF